MEWQNKNLGMLIPPWCDLCSMQANLYYPEKILLNPINNFKDIMYSMLQKELIQMGKGRDFHLCWSPLWVPKNDLSDPIQVLCNLNCCLTIPDGWWIPHLKNHTQLYSTSSRRLTLLPKTSLKQKQWWI